MLACEASRVSMNFLLGAIGNTIKTNSIFKASLVMQDVDTRVSDHKCINYFLYFLVLFVVGI